MRIFTLILFILFPSSILHSDESLNYGWNIPQTPLYVGGYFSTSYDPREINDLVFDDIALLFYANKEKYHLLGEVELSDIPLKHLDRKNLRLFIERFQLAYDMNENTTITLGKFYSKIGFWNISPINTLTDTTTSPYILESTFPELSSGLLYNYSFDYGDQMLSLTIQHNPDLDTSYNNIHINRHYALAYTYLSDSYTLRANCGYFRQINHQKSFYEGLSIQYENDFWTIQSELFSKQSTKHQNIPYNTYLQITRHLYNKHDIVFREELYKDNATNIQENISLIGYTYRPHPFIAFKSEYVKYSNLPKSRFIFSFSMVF